MLAGRTRFADVEIRVALDTISGDAASAVLSAVVLADDFRARRFTVWPNPRAGKPLSDAAYKEIARVLDL